MTPHCYYLSASIQRNYQGNIAFCSAERAQPLRIDGPSEQDWLKETAQNLIGTDKLWTGGNKADPNTGWNWFEWPSFPYVNWDSSQPDKEKDFITMNTANGKWQTHEENEVYFFTGSKMSGPKWTVLTMDATSVTLVRKTDGVFVG